MNATVPPSDSIEQPDPGQRDLSGELAPPTGDYLTQVDINHVLGNLFQLLSANKISTKRASALAYICFNILKSQEGMHDQVRFMELTGFKFLTKALREKYGPAAKLKAKLAAIPSPNSPNTKPPAAGHSAPKSSGAKSSPKTPATKPPAR